MLQQNSTLNWAKRESRSSSIAKSTRRNEFPISFEMNMKLKNNFLKSSQIYYVSTMIF